jgi:hypothetical protein
MMAVKKDAWERLVCMKDAMVVVVVDDGGGREGEDDSYNFDYSWGQVHRGKRHGSRPDQRHEGKEERVNDHLLVVGDIGSMVRVRLCSYTVGVGVDDNMKRVPDVNKVIVGLAC